MNPRPLWRGLTLFLAGAAGSAVFFLTLNIPPSIRTTVTGPELLVRFRLWAFNTILLAVGLLLGSAFAHRARLISLTAHRVAGARRLLTGLPLYAVTGVGIGLAMLALDSLLMNAVPSLRLFIQGHQSALSPLDIRLSVRSLYGGVTEELMWRWGVMSFAAWLFGRRLSRRWALAFAILLAASLFGLDHLPLLFQSVPDAPLALSLRVVLLNTAIGIAFGIAYACHSLEAAMVMHAAMHLSYFGVGVGSAT